MEEQRCGNSARSKCDFYLIQIKKPPAALVRNRETIAKIILLSFVVMISSPVIQEPDEHGRGRTQSMIVCY